jgi:hypothetical protein
MLHQSDKLPPWFSGPAVVSFTRQFPLDVLLEVFESAIDSPDDEIFDQVDPRMYYGRRNLDLSDHPRLTIPLVCKEWNEASKPYRWRTLFLTSISVDDLARRMEEDSSLCLLVRRIVVYHHKPSVLLPRILELCSSTRVLNCSFHVLTKEFLDAIVKYLPSLRMISFRLLGAIIGGIIADTDRPMLNPFLMQMSGRLSSLYIFLRRHQTRYILPSLSSITIPHLRLTDNWTWLSNSHHGDHSDQPPLIQICLNSTIKRLEICTNDHPNELAARLRDRLKPENRKHSNIIYYSRSPSTSVRFDLLGDEETSAEFQNYRRVEPGLTYEWQKL